MLTVLLANSSPFMVKKFEYISGGDLSCAKGGGIASTQYGMMGSEAGAT